MICHVSHTRPRRVGKSWVRARREKGGRRGGEREETNKESSSLGRCPRSDSFFVWRFLRGFGLTLFVCQIG